MVSNKSSAQHVGKLHELNVLLLTGHSIFSLHSLFAAEYLLLIPSSFLSLFLLHLIAILAANLSHIYLPSGQFISASIQCHSSLTSFLISIFKIYFDFERPSLAHGNLIYYRIYWQICPLILRRISSCFAKHLCSTYMFTHLLKHLFMNLFTLPNTLAIYR